MKVNIDGSYLESSNIMGIGGLIRSDGATWLAGFSGCEGKGDILQAELLAIYKGLNFAWSLNFRRVQCETDSLEAVNLLRDVGLHQFHVHADLLLKIEELLKRD